jgi:hypothetical protein
MHARACVCVHVPVQVCIMPVCVCVCACASAASMPVCVYVSVRSSFHLLCSRHFVFLLMIVRLADPQASGGFSCLCFPSYCSSPGVIATPEHAWLYMLCTQCLAHVCVASTFPIEMSPSPLIKMSEMSSFKSLACTHSALYLVHCETLACSC